MRSFLSSHSRKVTEALNFTGHDTPRQLVSRRRRRRRRCRLGPLHLMETAI